MLKDIPTTPVSSGFSTTFSSHVLVENRDGIGIVPTKGPLIFGLFFVCLTPVCWMLTRNLDIEDGLKLAAVLFPLFTGCGPLILWGIIKKFGSRFFFNRRSQQLQFSGLRFTQTAPIPLADIIAIQICYGGYEHSSAGSDSPSYHKYEFNIVLKKNGDLQRRNLLCHANSASLELQGRKIAKHLNIEYINSIKDSALWEDGEK
ncbi:hypothetical protein ACFL54_03070 [Planctomycetota bacterium]